MAENDTASDNTPQRASKDDVELLPVISTAEGTVVDPVFGEIPPDGTQYRSMSWLRTSVLMTKTQIGIGALSIPQAFAPLGIIPGVALLLLVAIITTWSGWMIGQFKRKHPHVYGIDDVGYIMLGWVGRLLFYGAFQLYYIFVGGSAILTIATAISVLSDHGTCDYAYILCAAGATYLLACVPTLSKVSWAAWVGMVCILASLLELTISVASLDRPAAAPKTGPWSSDWTLWGHSAPFIDQMSAISKLVFAFSGTAAYFPIAAEMERTEMYERAMYLCQSVVTCVYIVVGVVVCYFCGSFVSSPALGSAGPKMAKVCYGTALPGLCVTAMIVCHLPAKSLFVRALRGSRHLTAPSFTHRSVWLSCNAVVVAIAWLIASAVPAFSGLVTLIGALLGTSICITPFGMMWLHGKWNWRGNWRPQNSPDRSSWWILQDIWAILIVSFGLFVMVAGSIAAIKEISGIYRDNKSVAWACNGTLDM